MYVICWNIRTNNDKNIPDKLVSEAIKRSIDTTKPWVLAILENKSGGDAVGEVLRQRLSGTWSYTVPAGGGAHTSENVVLVGGGCMLKNCGIDTSWQEKFGGAFNMGYMSHVASAQEKQQTHGGSMRASTLQAGVDTARRDAPWDPSNCRNPVWIEVNDGTQNYRFGFVHSPGPREGVRWDDTKYAQAYFTCIMQSLQEYKLDGLMGDFNVYGSEPPRHDDGGLQDVSFDLGGTTFKKATNTVGDSRLDRAYLTARYALHSTASLVNGGSDASDHVGICIQVIDCEDRFDTLLAIAKAEHNFALSNSNVDPGASSSSSSVPMPSSSASSSWQHLLSHVADLHSSGGLSSSSSSSSNLGSGNAMDEGY
jgi:endonuclease/exonuclease/phosphatase family metal-dependent hydrolase